MIEQKNGREVLSKPRARKEAAKQLAMALQIRYRRLLEASGENEIVVATADLAQCMYDNIEFVVWALKSVGGLNPPPPHELHKVSSPAPMPQFEPPPKLDEVIAAEVVTDECTCPPLAPGIIGRDRHMTSCPKFKPS